MTFKDATMTSWTAIVAFMQAIARRAVEGGLVIAAAVITWHAFWWAFDYADLALTMKQDPLGTAAVLAAILGPLATLQGFTLAKYLDHKE